MFEYEDMEHRERRSDTAISQSSQFETAPIYGPVDNAAAIGRSAMVAATSVERPIHTQERTSIPITLVSNDAEQAAPVASLLRNHGIYFTTIYVEDLAEPHLEVGSDEVVGARKIEELLPRIIELAGL
jgi:hypothetical protein